MNYVTTNRTNMPLTTSLVRALQALGLQGEIMLGGRWVKLRGKRCAVYIAEIAWNRQYCTWCDNSQARTAEFYSDPIDAIRAGLRRAEIQQEDEHGQG
jgi:hypothetical protein